MAFTEKLPSGKYRGGYWAPKPGGGRRKVWVLGTYDRKQDAKQDADEAAVKARRRAPSAGRPIPASITWDDWWEMLLPDRVFDSDTGKNDQKIVEKYLSPRWGSVSLNQIVKKDDDGDGVQAWVDGLSKLRTPAGTPLSPGYVNKIYRLFAMTIKAALDHDPPILDVSPLNGIKLPKIVRKQKSFIEVHQVDPITAHLRADYADATEFDMETGLRPGELAGLHDQQVNRAARLITVTNVYVAGRKMIRGYPKDKDARTVGMSDRAIEIYDRQVAGRDMTGPCGLPHFDSEPCTSSLVFLTTRGGVIVPQNWRQAMGYAAKKKGAPPAVPYGGRRGFATRLARSRQVDLFELMAILGWSDPKLAWEYVQESTGAVERVLAALAPPEDAPAPLGDGLLARLLVALDDPAVGPVESSADLLRLLAAIMATEAPEAAPSAPLRLVEGDSGHGTRGTGRGTRPDSAAISNTQRATRRKTS